MFSYCYVVNMPISEKIMKMAVQEYCHQLSGHIRDDASGYGYKSGYQAHTGINNVSMIISDCQICLSYTAWEAMFANID